ncbi:pyridoxal phosphate-dependent aminotransferase [Candidatus Acetothermia bacterium]|nr:pyridoxal phosphate-dependent aminotransferase [Candidatus Acetothermia bacterium]
MPVRRLEGIPGFSIDRVAAAAGNDPEVLRLENLDTDLAPPAAAIAATQAAIGKDDANSYLPFTGTAELRMVVAQHLHRLTGHHYDANAEIVITCGGTEGMLDALLATTDPGDEVILTDPTYAGMTYRARLVGAVPKLVPFRIIKNEWRLDLEALRAAVSNRTRVMFIMNPSMPSGAVLNKEEWNEIAKLCKEHSLWLIYNAAMERILFDQHPYIHPATLDGMRERTITVGSVSKEYRMIGWRVGWVAGPKEIMSDIARVHIYNVVTPTGISQAGAVAALQSPEQDFLSCVAEWERRRNTVLEQLKEFPVISAAGGWSLLIDVKNLGYDSFTASKLLLEKSKIAATPMRDWGQINGDQFVRLVFSNEPVKRLAELRDRTTRALR